MVEIRKECLELLDKLEFVEHRDKPGLYIKSSGDSDHPNVAYIDFRSEPKGARYCSNKQVDPDSVESLRAFKEARDAIIEGKTITTPKTKEIVQPKAYAKEIKPYKTGRTYKVSGKDVPDAGLTQREANEKCISTRIMASEQDDIHAKAVVRAEYFETGQYAEAVVNHDYSLMKEVILMDLVKEAERNGKKVIEGMDDNGKPILTTEYHQRFYERFIRAKYFALRDAETKATRRAQLKLLNREWREPEELEGEKVEQRLVEAK